MCFNFLSIFPDLSLPVGDWKWDGCNENIEYGIKKSKDYLDSRYKKRSDMKTLVKLHNYVAGRLVSLFNNFYRQMHK